MKAIVWTKYGPPHVLQLKEVEKPTPKENEVLIKVMATTAFAGDCEVRNLKVAFLIKLPLRIYVGLWKPKRITILGQELAGTVEAVGEGVTRFKVGDAVFASTGFSFGAYAEYKCLPEDGAMALKPSNISYEEASAVPVGGLEALHFIRKGAIQPGQRVLINGAGGSIGTFAVQLAKLFGAEVTAVDSTTKLDMLRSIGADHVIDYTQENFTKRNQRYDVIFDVIGKSQFSGSVGALKENGRYLIANPSFLSRLRARWTSAQSNKKVIVEAASLKRKDLIYLKELIEAGQLQSIIDRTFPLAETAAAHSYVETGAKQGSVVIAVAEPL